MITRNQLQSLFLRRHFNIQLLYHRLRQYLLISVGLDPPAHPALSPKRLLPQLRVLLIYRRETSRGLALRNSEGPKT